MHTGISHAPSPRAEVLLWSLGQTHFVILESLLERQEAIWIKDARGSHFWELIVSWGHWCWQVPFWSLPSGLLMPRALPAHQQVSPSLGTQLHIPTGHPQPTRPWAIPSSRHSGLCSHLHWDLTWLTTTTWGRTWEPTGLGASFNDLWAHRSHHNRKAHATQIRGTPRLSSGP